MVSKLTRRTKSPLARLDGGCLSPAIVEGSAEVENRRLRWSLGTHAGVGMSASRSLEVLICLAVFDNGCIVSAMCFSEMDLFHKDQTRV